MNTKNTCQPMTAEQLVEIGERYMEAGLVREAQRIFKEAVLCAPENPKTHCRYGEALMKDPSKRHEAIVFLTNAVFLDPDNEQYHQALADAAHRFWLSREVARVLYGMSDDENTAEQEAVRQTFAAFRRRYREAQEIPDTFPILKAA